MDMTNCINELKQKLGDAVSMDPQIVRSYDHDLGEMPVPLMKMIKHVPDMVVAARTPEDVTEALRFANSQGISVTPRGQATSGYGGAIPCTGGMVLDLSGLNRIISIDQEAMTVDVEPGVVWETLSHHLAGHGLDNRITPTSGPSSTVGGWLAMGGVGIGSLRFGGIGDVVEEIEVAGVDGSLKVYRGEPMDLFHQTCGILGVVTRLRLRCRPLKAVTPLAAWLPDADAVARILPMLEQDEHVYSVTVQSSEYAAIRAKAEGHHTPVQSGFLLSIATLEGDAATIGGMVEEHNGHLLDEGVGRTEWQGRYYPMRIKRVGPSAIVGEFFVPFDKFNAWWRQSSKKLSRDQLAIEAIATQGGRLAILVYLLDDSRSLLYPLRMAKAMIPLRVALHNGGAIYAPGMWFARHSKSFFGTDKYRRVIAMKRVLDPKGILNPGKIRGPRLPFIPGSDLSSVIYHASNLIGPLSALLPNKGSRAVCAPDGVSK